MARRPKGQDENQIDYRALKDAAEKIVLPHLDKILAKMVAEALGDGRGAQQAREYLLNRLFGRPTEHIQQESRQEITITVRPLDTPPEAVEGAVRVVPLPAEDALLALAEPSPLGGADPPSPDPAVLADRTMYSDRSSDPSPSRGRARHAHARPRSSPDGDGTGSELPFEL